MCEVTFGDVDCGANDSLIRDEDNQWAACGRKLQRGDIFIKTRGQTEILVEDSSAPFPDLPPELCDPMRRKITSLKPSLTPGAGTRVVRRRKPASHVFVAEPISDSEEAFRRWRDAMRAVARLPDGIPPKFRRRVWLALANHQFNAQHLNWLRLKQNLFAPRCAKTVEDERLGRQIVKDLHRTGCGELVETEDDREALKRVLTAYSRWNRRVGYCQGFNIIAAVILNVMERNEEEALKIMIFLIDFVLPESYFTGNLQALFVDVAVFRELLAVRQPELAAHLQKLQEDAAVEDPKFSTIASTKSSSEPPLTNLYAIQWFLTLFSTCLPMDVVLRTWDALFLEGSEVGLRAGLVVMDILSEDLMKLTSADSFYSSMNRWMEEIAEGSDRSGMETRDFIRRVYEIAPLPWQFVGDLRKNYTNRISSCQGEESILLYGDVYYEQSKEKTKSKWWQIKPRRPLACSDTPVHLQNPSMVLRRAEDGAEGKGTEGGTESGSGTNHSQPSLFTSPLDGLFKVNSPEEPLNASDGFFNESTTPVTKFDLSDNGSTGELSGLITEEKTLPRFQWWLGASNQDTDALTEDINDKLQSRCQWPLPTTNDYYVPQTPEKPTTSRRTSIHVDDSVLQTIDEWQRRNVVAVSNGDPDGIDSKDSNTPPLFTASESSPSSPTPQKTLLSIAAQKRVLDYGRQNNETSPPDSPSLTSLLAKTILRDRAKPADDFTSAATQEPARGLSPANIVEAASLEPRAAPSSPPWAAAMSAISASTVVRKRTRDSITATVDGEPKSH
uniref:Rab-GAP TBC domain-containing protein n=1 Tax=Mesocestoides corti TaxID=53468 RepID=A0A5K3FAM0_MESCO